MHLHLIRLAIMLAGIGPFLAIPALLLTFYLRRGLSKKKRPGRRINASFTPSTFALGISLQYLEKTFAQPGVEHVLQEKYHEATEEDESSDPTNPERYLRQQLKQIRNGKPVDRLIVPQTEALCRK